MMTSDCVLVIQNYIQYSAAFPSFCTRTSNQHVNDGELWRWAIVICFISRLCARNMDCFPLYIRQFQTYSSFRRHLKTHYFQSAYPAAYSGAYNAPWFSSETSAIFKSLTYLLTYLLTSLFTTKADTYRVGQIKLHHFTFLLVTHECNHTILWFLAHINYIMQKMRWC